VKKGKGRGSVIDAIERLNVVCGIIAGCGILALVAFLAVSVIMRYLFHRPLEFGEEITGYLLVLIVFLGLAYSLKIGAHIRTDVLTRYAPDRLRYYLEIIAYVFGLTFAAIFTVAGWKLVIKNYIHGTIDFGSLMTPVWIPMTLVGIGATLLLVQFIITLVRLITK
jgi:TRAP-type C4-dicarboxylate transport system permease small subunit